MNIWTRRSGTVILMIVFLLVMSTPSLLAKELRFLAVGYPLALTDYLNKEVVPAFKAKHGVDVIIDTGVTWNTRMDKILVSIAGGVPYDIVVTGFYSPIEEGSNGLLAPLDSYLANWSSTNKYPAPIWKAMQWQGKTYVVPQNSSVRVIGYNKALYAQSGLDPEAPPQSWEQLVRYSRMLTRIEGGQVTVRGFSSNTGPAGYAQDLFWYMRQAGVTEFNETTFTANLNTKEALDALNHLAEICEVNQYALPIVSGGFAAERIVMQRQYPGMWQKALVDNPDLIPNYGVFLPRMTPSSPAYAHGFFDGIAILSASQNKDLAWAFIETMYERETLAEIEHVSGFLSGNLDLVSRQLRTVPKIDLFYNSYSYATNSMIPPPRTTSQTELGKLVEQVVAKTMSSREALERCQEIWNRLLAEWKSTLK